MIQKSNNIKRMFFGYRINIDIDIQELIHLF